MMTSKTTKTMKLRAVVGLLFGPLILAVSCAAQQAPAPRVVDLARENAKKALQVLPTDTTATRDFRKGLQQNAEEKLKQLGDKP